MTLIHLGWLLLALTSLTRICFAEVPADLPRLCYTGKNELAPSYLVPCFNAPMDDGGVYGCCLAGDICLENQACHNKYKGITYQKGCTSSDYDGTKCPRKCNTDRSKADWVSLIYCNGTHGTPKDTWVCQHPDNCFAPDANCPLSATWDPKLEMTRTTHCEDIKHDKAWVAFEGKKSLKSTASLPLPSYVSAWWDAHSNYSTRWDSETPPSQTVPYTPTKPTDPLSNTTSSASGFSRPTSSSHLTTALPKGTSLSRGNKIGMAVGLGLGIPLLLAVLGFLLYFLRKRHNGEGAGDQPWPDPNSGDGAAEDERAKGSANETYDCLTKAELPADVRHDYPTKAELPAHEKPGQVPEMEGSSVGEARSPMASPLLSKDARKEDVRDDGKDKAPVYELPG
ncbi:hypothetical protein P171DRAFT_438173 [Karstenula rhodostoma CBS 690.94]|uniref:Mid2 domain-containing protein n=1 Tax=Karstenula rhodostoma CBS 690.94 TaxID=1392251 RepID=A0A9P4PWE1_9PLEO|nr:hypothetical protein P171DRAFT_438173 [Karstenula rhodostoma CBS 690.94]